MPRRRERRKLKVNTFAIVSDAIDIGISYGLRRAHKHVDEPGEEVITEAIRHEIMNALCEVIDFGEEETE